jgi:predicted amidohydrolase YtcJ
MNRLALAFLLLLPLIAFAQSQKADLILIHGQVLSVDAHDTVAQAIAVRGGIILKVGSDAEIRALADPHTQVIDLKGHTATPGLIDTHAHIALGGVE